VFVLLRELHRLRGDLGLKRGAGASLAIRHVDAGSCNGCEHELNAASNPYHDLQRYGLGVVASPRHADVLLVTGTPTVRMRRALLVAYEAMPEPRLVAALGDCALGCNVLGEPDQLQSLESLLPVHVRIPGCPPNPARIASGLIEAIALARSTAVAPDTEPRRTGP
jgi:Ni,Fe-hydrogenase III small subunit